MDFAEVLEKIKTQSDFIDGVVITGGEPTLHPHLIKIIKTIKDLGLLVKLDTNGTNPEMLKKLVNEKLIDYVAMDIKAPLEKYEEMIGTKVDTHKIKESIEFLKTNPCEYMFRTTLYPLIQEKEIREIGKLLKGATTYQLQQFVPNDFSNGQPRVLLPHLPQTVHHFAKILEPFVGQVLVRGL